MDDLSIFMHIYMYELELWLNEHRGEIATISFRSDEANTDRPLKEYLKQVIGKQCNCIRPHGKRTLQFFDENGLMSEYPLDDGILGARIEHIYLPEELTAEMKSILKRRKKAVFTNPDLCLLININGKIKYETVELKSTKTDAIPGSSVQQISPNEWVIFVKHTKKNVEIAVGQYFHAVNSRMQFPDRSPRPQVSFNELKNWNRIYRSSDVKTLVYRFGNDESFKRTLLTDWQSVLAEEWLQAVLDVSPGKKSPWFHDNLRKFVLKFLSKYDGMSESEKELYKNNLLHIVEES